VPQSFDRLRRVSGGLIYLHESEKLPQVWALLREYSLGS
jgi:hypothetical protein